MDLLLYWDTISYKLRSIPNLMDFTLLTLKLFIENGSF